MGGLNIDTMCANTPQAKGCVERANSTQQDRLVKELRLAGIFGIDEANAFAVGFVEDFNRRFGRPDLSPHNAHRLLRSEENPCDISALAGDAQGLAAAHPALQPRNVSARQIQDARDAMGKQVQIREAEDGCAAIWHQGNELPARAFEKEGHVQQGVIVDNKLLARALEFAEQQQEVRDAKKSQSARHDQTSEAAFA